MAKRKAAKAETKSQVSPHFAAMLFLAAAVAVFHWEPLFSSQASIQWDAVDVTYSAQKYFSDFIRQGKLPHWTPYVFSGYPFLSDPQTGAWYPLNWPFLAAGITPGAIQLQLALHTLIAAAGAYLLAFGLARQREAAVAAAAIYAFSGFFAGHSSHVGMFQTAAWLPWILLAAGRGVEEEGLCGKTAAGVFAGVMALAGHFQTALYGGCAAALYAGWLVARDRTKWKAAAGTLALSGALGAGIAAVMIVPAAELAGESVRQGMDFSAATNSPLIPGTLGTLIYPNIYGLHEGNYRGPEDVTQHYFYAGLLLLPLAGWGLRNPRVRWAGLTLIVPALWYSLGPGTGLYDVMGRLPGLRSVRAPVHVWFVVGMGLALLASAGVAAAIERWKLPWLGWALAGVLAVDAYWFNSATNPLAYARKSFAELYGNRLDEFRQRLAAQLPPLTRFHAPYSLETFGPQNHALDARAATTYGYNPLRLTRYNEFLSAAAENPRLLAEIGAKFRYNPEARGVEVSDAVLPRVTIPKRILGAGNASESRKALRSLDPAEAAIVEGGEASTQDAGATVTVAAYSEGEYRLRYRAAAPTLLRIAEAYYPGWQAEMGGRELPVKAVDHALLGVMAPAGEGEIVVRFGTRRFGGAAGVSVASAAIAAAIILRTLRSRRKEFPTPPAGSGGAGATDRAGA